MFQAEQLPSQAGNVIDANTLKTEFVANGYIVHLFLENNAPTPQWTHTDFAAVEAGFTGYAPIELGGAGFLWNGPLLNSQDQIVLESAAANFVATDAVTPQNIGGWWIENTATAVRRYGIFPIPLPMIAAMQFINMTLVEAPGLPGYADVNN